MRANLLKNASELAIENAATSELAKERERTYYERMRANLRGKNASELAEEREQTCGRTRANLRKNASELA